MKLITSSVASSGKSRPPLVQVHIRPAPMFMFTGLYYTRLKSPIPRAFKGGFVMRTLRQDLSHTDCGICLCFYVYSCLDLGIGIRQCIHIYPLISIRTVCMDVLLRILMYTFINTSTGTVTCTQTRKLKQPHLCMYR